jgi:hypothetical protein
VGEERTEGAQSEPQYLTVGEAAKVLGVHRNTIHYRIKTGRIKAHKVLVDDRDDRREVYRIEADSLGVGRTSAGVYTLDAQRPTAGEELAHMIAARLDEIVRDYTHELGEVREQLGAERVRREMAEERAASSEERAAALEAELEAIRATPDPLQASEPADDEQQGRGPAPDAEGAHEATERPFAEEPEEPRRRSWWREFFGFE